MTIPTFLAQTLAVAIWAGLLQPGAASSELIVCGRDELVILDVGGTTPKKLWSWRAKDRPELPVYMRDKFRAIDECKPVAAGTQFLITASSDGVAVVQRGSGEVKFYALAVNAHSAELLPGGRIAVAASHRPDAEGDRLIIFDRTKPDKPLFHTELTWGHGVVWDERRQVLWALSDTELRAYRLREWNSASPSLSKTAEYRLPDTGGHDLSAVPDSSMLALTTGRHCWLFDRERQTFFPHPVLAEQVGVKCINTNPATRQTVWVKAEGGNWWTDKLQFLDPERVIRLPGERLYKARWIPPPLK